MFFQLQCHFYTFWKKFWLWTYFQETHPKDGKNQLDFQMKNFMLNHLKKKIPRKNQIFKNLARPWQLLVRLSAAIKFLFGFGLFRNTQENQNQLIRTKTIGFNWGKNLLIISKGKIFRANCCEQVSDTMSITLFWWSWRFINFFLFILLQFCYW